MVLIEERLVNSLRDPKRIVMTDEDTRVFNEATHCYVSDEELRGDSVRDHCHVTAKYRGAAHNACNLNLKHRERIPVFVHNLRGYDAHLIVSSIAKMKSKKINCIPQNHEKYISFSLEKLEFINTFQFLSTSLGKLIENVAVEWLEKFYHLPSYAEMFHPGKTCKKLSLLSRKGVYPYRYIHSFNKFEEFTSATGCILQRLGGNTHCRWGLSPREGRLECFKNELSANITISIRRQMSICWRMFFKTFAIFV